MNKNGDIIPLENVGDGEVEEEVEFKPSHAQKAVLEIACKQGLHRSVKAIAKEADLDESTIFKWLKKPGFKRAWAGLTLEIVGRHLPSATAAMMNKAMGGDIPAVKLALQAAKVIGSGGVELHVGDKIGQQVNLITTAHLQYVERAENHEQFVRIQKAVREATAEAIDVEVVDGDTE